MAVVGPVTCSDHIRACGLVPGAFLDSRPSPYSVEKILYPGAQGYLFLLPDTSAPHWQTLVGAENTLKGMCPSYRQPLGHLPRWLSLSL